MNFEFDKFTEEWAQIYAPMKHTPGIDGTNKRFFICDSYMAMTEFMTGMEPENSPCVIIESQQEGNVDHGKDYPRYAMYFMVRANEMNDGHEAVKAKKSAKQVMIDFVNFIRPFKYYEDYGKLIEEIEFKEGSYLYQLREAVRTGDYCMQNIGIDNFTYESLNQLYDGWYGVQLSLEDMVPYSMCLDQYNYE